MNNPLKTINKKVNHLITALSVIGVFLIILSILIVITDFLLRWIVGIMVLVVAFGFLIAAYRIWSFKAEAKHFLEKLQGKD